MNVQSVNFINLATLQMRRNSLLSLTLISASMLGVLSGCSKGSSSASGAGLQNDVSPIPLRVVVADKDQTAVPFPSLAVSGCPASEVRRLLREAEKDYAADTRQAQATLASCEAIQSKADLELDRGREALSKQYNGTRPQNKEDVIKDRNPLAALSKARAAKTEVDREYQQLLRSKLAPLEDGVRQAALDVAAAKKALNRLQAEYRDRLFDALPSEPERRWKTDNEGRATLAIERNEPWYIWASGTRQVTTGLKFTGRRGLGGAVEGVVSQGAFVQETFRWLLLIPDDLDSAGQLSLDQSNTFDGRAAVRSLGDPGSDSPLLSR